MSTYGVAASIDGPIQVSRTTRDGTAVGSLLGRQGRARPKDASAAGPLITQCTARKPCGLAAAVLGANTKPYGRNVTSLAKVVSSHRSKTAVARPKTKSTSPSM